jgi:purine-cytosine permease-like protein
LFRDRIFKSYGSLMLTFTAIAAASYSYLVGAALIGVGSTRLGILGYLVGLILGMSFVSLAGGSLSFRYGVDPVDASKASLGMRGSIVLLVGVLVCTLGWANVLLAMTAQAAVRMVHMKGIDSGASHNIEVTLTVFTLITAVWLLVRRGAGGMERVANACAAIQIIIAAILLSTILLKYGAVKAWMTDIPAAQAYGSNRMMQLTYGVEFGLCNSLGMLPYMGGLARLVGKSRHLVGPSVIGYGIFGAFLIAAIGALATATTGETDPSVWIPTIAGSGPGRVLLAVMLIANLGALVTQVYLAGISIQQIRTFARLRWSLVAALVLVPSMVVAFNTRWVIDHVMNWLAYNGVMFVGLGSILFVDFFLLRDQRVVAAQLFAVERGRHYWFWGGVNWIAMVTIAASTAMYLWLFDPTSLRVGRLFRFAGATIPTVMVASATYYLLMRRLIGSGATGHYRSSDDAAPSLPVSL